MIDTNEYNIRVSTPEDAALPWYDHTTLQAVSTCPRYGVITYRNNKRLYGKTKNDALLAGNAAHKFFAAYNLFPDQTIPHAFTDEELEHLRAVAEMAEPESARTAFAVEAIYSHKDGLPDDTSRSKSADKIEKSCLYWVARQNHDRTIVATEVQFSITINDAYRFVGLIDCIQRTPRGTLIPVEYKTASRIDKAYEIKWALSRQITGYHLAMQAYMHEGKLGDGSLADYIEVEALQLPMTKSESSLPHMRRPFEREDWHYKEFLDWCNENIDMAHQASSVPYDAPTREACYRYNSICPLLTEFCTFDPETREEIYNTMMETSVWDPTAT